MGTLEEVKNMQNQGFSEEQIIQSLRNKNTSYKEISEALAQSKIRAAVQEEVPTPASYSEEMQQSLMSNQEQYPEQYSQQVPQTSQPQEYQYPQYQQESVSTDTITEISEQVVSSKISELRRQIEKTLDVRTVMETKLESLDERLKRLEKIIDTLQSSVLRKVGDYVTNVEDIKKELVETQKTFSKLVERKK